MFLLNLEFDHDSYCKRHFDVVRLMESRLHYGQKLREKSQVQCDIAHIDFGNALEIDCDEYPDDSFRT